MRRATQTRYQGSELFPLHRDIGFIRHFLPVPTLLLLPRKILFRNMGKPTPAATPIVIATLFPTLAIVIVAGRFWARCVKKIAYKPDDWMVLVALVGLPQFCAHYIISNIYFQIACVGNAITLIIAATDGELGRKQSLDPEGNPYPNPALETFQKVAYRI